MEWFLLALPLLVCAVDARTELVNVAAFKPVSGVRSGLDPAALTDEDDLTWSATATMNDPYLKIDLGSEYLIKNLQLMLDQNAGRNLINSMVRVGSSSVVTQNPVCIPIDDKYAPIMFEKNCNMKGRYIILQKMGPGRTIRANEIRAYVTMEIESTTAAPTTKAPTTVQPK
ncbi:uncharacterized protein LOC100376619 [Saccoglossus kowalevskii]|uniref:Uncharacterized protein LOC100376619 n=1 Tax=Saccoglossus kowalevskii TaxID=10224 RepID=A0ABM0M4L7_SACKO|nr:PREDICTED: uncharacterized protein LOC100376619 [Saccoglossus kowalevskii]